MARRRGRPSHNVGRKALHAVSDVEEAADEGLNQKQGKAPAKPPKNRGVKAGDATKIDQVSVGGKGRRAVWSGTEWSPEELTELEECIEMCG